MNTTDEAARELACEFADYAMGDSLGRECQQAMADHFEERIAAAMREREEAVDRQWIRALKADKIFSEGASASDFERLSRVVSYLRASWPGEEDNVPQFLSIAWEEIDRLRTAQPRAEVEASEVDWLLVEEACIVADGEDAGAGKYGVAYERIRALLARAPHGESEPQRYQPQGDKGMYPNPEGKWLRYDDMAELFAEKRVAEAERNALREENELLKDAIRGEHETAVLHVEHRSMGGHLTHNPGCQVCALLRAEKPEHVHKWISWMTDGKDHCECGAVKEMDESVASDWKVKG